MRLVAGQLLVPVVSLAQGPFPGGPAARLTFEPMVSPDGRYLFFSGGERGRVDIYWVSAEVLRAGPR